MGTLFVEVYVACSGFEQFGVLLEERRVVEKKVSEYSLYIRCSVWWWYGETR